MGHILFTHSHEGRWDVLTCWLFMWLWMYNDADMNPDLQIYSFAPCLGAEDLKDHFQLPSFVTASLLPALYTKGLRSLLPMDRRSWYVRLQPPCLWMDGWMDGGVCHHFPGSLGVSDSISQSLCLLDMLVCIALFPCLTSPFSSWHFLESLPKWAVPSEIFK